jgi:hypothetical protein
MGIDLEMRSLAKRQSRLSPRYTPNLGQTEEPLSLRMPPAAVAPKPQAPKGKKGFYHGILNDTQELENRQEKGARLTSFKNWKHFMQ